MDRREVLRLIGATAVVRPCYASTALSPSLANDPVLDEMTRRGCLYFAEQASPVNGQVLDRARWVGSDGRLDQRKMASIAATGFGLSALCIAAKRGYQPTQHVVEQVRRTLRFHCEVMPHVHGFFYHFSDLGTGQPWNDTELSSIDTALLLCGVLTARAYFSHDDEIVKLATKLYERVDWPWMLNGESTFSMGMRRGEFLKSRWNHYSELMMLYLLALGSPTHPIESSCWDAWARPTMHYDGFTYISAADPLFVHQYSHAWFDFRNRHDHYADYFANSLVATKAHRAFCLDLGKPYSPGYWCISASDSQHGYTAWGGPGSRGTDTGHGFGGIDGSVVPYAAAGSLPFLPKECAAVLHSLRDRYGPAAWGRYGFADAFHPDKDWYDSDVLGIDLGISVLMAENLRTEFIWQTFAQNPEVSVAMSRAGFSINSSDFAYR